MEKKTLSVNEALKCLSVAEVILIKLRAFDLFC